MPKPAAPAFHNRPATAALIAVALLVPLPVSAQDAARGTAVTVLRAARACFDATVDVSGVLTPRNEVPVGAPRDGLKVSEAPVDPGEPVSAGQVLARFTAPDGAAVTLPAPVAGVASAANALIGMTVSRQAEPLFKIIANGEFDLAAQADASAMQRLKVDQVATVRVAGAGAVNGKVRQVSPSIETHTQLGRVFISIETSRRLLANAAAQASIKTGESCGIAVPLTAVLYGGGTTLVQVVRHDRVETRRVETGLMSGGQVEIRKGLSEGDVVVARAGALLREGDAVRPIATETSPTASETGKAPN
jgi:multidrug efflux pump subunit AcrA (membrane-fusion protein)